MFGVPAMSNASEANTDVVPDQPTVIRAFLVLDGVQKEISLEEMEAIKAESQERQQNMLAQKQKSVLSKNQMHAKSEPSGTFGPASLLDLSYYNESGFISNVYRWDLNRRISPPVHNTSTTTTNSYTISYSTSQSFTSNFSFSTSGQKSAVTAGITVGAAWQNTYSVSQSVTQNIPPEKYGWMDYTPIMDNSYGILHEEVWSVVPGSAVELVNEDHFLDLYIAKKTSTNIPDGLYTIVESSSYPTY